MPTGHGVSERNINSGGEYTPKELRELIADNSEDLRELKAMVNTVLKNQESYMEHCDVCKTKFTEDISSLRSDMSAEKVKTGVIMAAMTAGISFITSLLVMLFGPLIGGNV